MVISVWISKELRKEQGVRLLVFYCLDLEFATTKVVVLFNLFLNLV